MSDAKPLTRADVEAEIRDKGGTIEGWFYGDVTDEPTRRRITKAARALAKRLRKAGAR